MPDSTPNPLAGQLRKFIQLNGPMTFRDWMHAALYHPQHGYYCREDKQRWGRAADYRTSPERASLFAATFARYFAELYRKLNSPTQWRIVEMGAGNGQFARGVLQTLKVQHAEIFAATEYVVVEIHPPDLILQELLRSFPNVRFASLDNLVQPATGVIFSNELVDAFPVHRVISKGNQLQEMYVALDEAGEFSWQLGPLSTSALTEYFDVVDAQLSHEGQIGEVNLEVREWLSRCAELLRSGYLVTVDYGDEAPHLFSLERRQGTLRAFRQHQFQEALEHPGENDITTTVDWTYLRKTGEQLGLRTESFGRLDQFLLHAGLLEQLELMSESADTEADRAALRASAREMILATGMAGSFQVLVQQK